jgi:hypothetical protein
MPMRMRSPFSPNYITNGMAMARNLAAAAAADSPNHDAWKDNGIVRIAYRVNPCILQLILVRTATFLNKKVRGCSQGLLTNALLVYLATSRATVLFVRGSGR